MHKNLSYRLKNLLIQLLALMIMAASGPIHAQGIAPETAAYDRTAAVIFAYQRIGEDLHPANNLSTEQFKNHITELIEGEYHVAPLSKIVEAFQSGTKLPEKTVAITFNGAYQSALENAIPVLLANNLPFTVFFSPDQADGKTPEYMGWDDIKRLSRSSQVTLGLHPASYMRLTESPEEEIRRQVNKALNRYREELKSEPEFFAYPFGEYTKNFRDIIAASGFKAAFGQQSGVAYSGSDQFALPRFAMTESYGDDERFRMAALALPLPVSDITPDDPHLAAGTLPIFGFTLDETLADKIPLLSCFISQHGKAEIQVVGKNRLELRVGETLENERIRINCTMPGPDPKPGEDQRWRWFGLLFSINQPGEHPEDYDKGETPSGPFPN
ncbi:MAG: polysaccharide deacetylase family protein [Micavibrio sp.]